VTLFLLCVAVLVMLALACILPPLLRHRGGGMAAGGEVGTTEANIAVLRDHLRELDLDLERGVINAEGHARSRAELIERTAEESRQETVERQSRVVRWSPVLVALLLPVGAMSLYVLLGAPNAFVESAPQAHVPQDMEDAVSSLARRLESNPDDVEGWMMLARSRNVMEQYTEALRAYEQLMRLQPQNADVLADYADTLAMVNNRSLQGQPEAFIRRALDANPNHPKALALAGTAAFERKDYKHAIGHWEQILHLVPADSDLAQTTTKSIAEARRLLPGGDTIAVAQGGVSGRVELDPVLRDRVSNEDIVFVFAREIGGPAAPLAAIRRRAADLPFDFRLDDTTTMVEGRKLSGTKQVVVGARISASGNALDRQHALEVITDPVPNGATGLRLRIAAGSTAQDTSNTRGRADLRE
jgi:cytochrome c-type biogenesis protein CcmH